MVPVEGDKDAKHLGLITPEWQRARTNLAIPPGHANIEVFADGMEVGVARCAAVQMARENNLKYLFFIDWDTLIPPDALLKLCYHLDNNPDMDVASGLYCMKSLPTFPLIWKDWNQGVCFDFTLGDVLKEGIVGVPMGCCLLRLSLFDKMANTPENPWFKTVNEPVFCGGQWGRMCMTEDLWFTRRFTEEVDRERRKIMVDTSVYCEHICHATGRRYGLSQDSLPMKRLAEKQGPHAPPAQPTPPVVLHVGCGTAPLPAGYEGMEEVRLDIDVNCKPDVVGSITDIPLMTSTVDVVYSSHNLEHVSAVEVPVVLGEFYRVLKKGGKLRLELPDVQAVLEAIPKIGMDGTLYDCAAGPITPTDVLWGWKKELARGNDFYGHKVGFTKESLEAALRKAQFTNVTVTRHPEGYALSAEATRP